MAQSRSNVMLRFEKRVRAHLTPHLLRMLVGVGSKDCVSLPLSYERFDELFLPALPAGVTLSEPVQSRAREIAVQVLRKHGCEVRLLKHQVQILWKPKKRAGIEAEPVSRRLPPTFPYDKQVRAHLTPSLLRLVGVGAEDKTQLLLSYEKFDEMFIPPGVSETSLSRSLCREMIVQVLQEQGYDVRLWKRQIRIHWKSKSSPKPDSLAQSLAKKSQSAAQEFERQIQAFVTPELVEEKLARWVQNGVFEATFAKGLFFQQFSPRSVPALDVYFEMVERAFRKLGFTVDRVTPSPVLEEVRVRWSKPR